MDIKAYISPLLRWWWLIVVSTAISFISAFIVTQSQPLTYQARTTLIMGREVYELNPSGSDMYLSQQLATYYADLAQREVVRKATMDALGIDWLPQFSAHPLPNSQFIEISVIDVVPERAMIVANELANQLIKQTPETSEAGTGFIDGQLEKLEVGINETELEINQKEADLGNLTSARQIAEVEGEIAALQDKLSRLQTTYATLIANSNEGATNTLSVVEPATLPQYPEGPNKKFTVLLSALVGFTLAIGAAYLLEFIDDSLKTAEDVERALKLPVIGQIPRITKKSDENAYVDKYPRSPLAEAFRSLRTNIEFLGVDHPLKTILISSPEPAEGKTFVAINLAVSLAHAGKRVILVDADLRNPSVHRFLGLENQIGLSDLFIGSVDLQDTTQTMSNKNWMVVTSGALPPNPTELIGSHRMKEILEAMQQIADVIVIDGPPFIVSDATILSAQSHGVLLIVRSGYTRRKMAHNTLEQLKRARARVLGITLNQLPRASTEYYDYYTTEKMSGRRGFLFRDRRNQDRSLLDLLSFSETSSNKQADVSRGKEPIKPVRDPSK